MIKVNASNTQRKSVAIKEGQERITKRTTEKVSKQTTAHKDEAKDKNRQHKQAKVGTTKSGKKNRPNHTNCARAMPESGGVGCPIDKVSIGVELLTAQTERVRTTRKKKRGTKANEQTRT
jgi:hypothetical protein